MASQLLSAVKFGILAAVAFSGPKWITDSGEYLGRVEKKVDGAYHHEKSLIQPGNTADFSEKESSAKENSAKEISAADFQPVLEGTGGGKNDSSAGMTNTSGGMMNFDVQQPSAAVTVRRPNLSPAASPIPLVPLEQAVRFDLTPGNITAVWSNVTADDSDPPSRGYRVPLLTGTASDDLAGALCYWYGRQRLERITFTGQTGDFRKILPFLEYRYGMTLDDDSTPGIYRYHAAEASPFFAPLHLGASPSRPVSRLTIQPSAQLDAVHPDRNYTVSFELFRPD